MYINSIIEVYLNARYIARIQANITIIILQIYITNYITNLYYKFLINATNVTQTTVNCKSMYVSADC